MCLYVRNPQERIAEEDIIVYKFVIQAFGDKLFAPYRKTTYPIMGNLLTSALNYESTYYTPYWLSLANSERDDMVMGEVHLGIHSFAEYEPAKSAMLDFLSVIPFKEFSVFYNAHNPDENSPTVKLVKCRIPKGAKYYVGTFSNHPSYASDQLIMDELLEFQDEEEA